jgi:hypothetical protein
MFMKLVTLNIWGGQKHKELLEFIKKINGKIDIICLQEVFKSDTDIFSNGSKMNIYSDLEKILTIIKYFILRHLLITILKTRLILIQVSEKQHL